MAIINDLVHSPKNSMLCFKVAYNDEKYEVFNHCNIRRQWYDGDCAASAYIGTFNEAQFDALLAKYMQ